MNENDLEKFKSAWKNEKAFSETELGREDILKFMNSTSKDLSAKFRSGIVIDAALKVLIAVSLGSIILLMKSLMVILLVSALVFLIALSLVFHMNVYKNIPGKMAEKNMITLLKDYVSFYYTRYITSLLTAAFSSPLIFISGSLYYYYIKYGAFPELNTDDYIVMGIFTFAGFLISAISHIWNFNFHIRQLEENLIDIENDTISITSLERYWARRRKLVIIMSFVLIVGIFLLLLFIYFSNY